MNRLLGVLVAMTLASSSANADEAEAQKNVLLVNPGDLFNGVISLEYERGLTDHFGLAIGAYVATFHGPFVPILSPTYTAFGPELSARFHFIKPAPGGLWFGPSLNLVYVAQRSGGTVTQLFGYGVGAAIGYTFIVFTHLALQLGIGGGFNDFGDGLIWAPRLRLGIGAAF